MAIEIFNHKSQIIEKAQQQKIGLREILTSTKLQKLLQTIGYPIKIGNLKALLKELGFNWNGASCSLTQFIEKLRTYCRKQTNQRNGQADYPSKNEDNRPKTEKRQMPIDCDTLHKVMMDRELVSGDTKGIRSVLAQILYNSEKTLHQIF